MRAVDAMKRIRLANKRFEQPKALQFLDKCLFSEDRNSFQSLRSTCLSGEQSQEKLALIFEWIHSLIHQKMSPEERRDCLSWLRAYLRTENKEAEIKYPFFSIIGEYWMPIKLYNICLAQIKEALPPRKKIEDVFYRTAYNFCSFEEYETSLLEVWTNPNTDTTSEFGKCWELHDISTSIRSCLALQSWGGYKIMREGKNFGLVDQDWLNERESTVDAGDARPDEEDAQNEGTNL